MNSQQGLDTEKTTNGHMIQKRSLKENEIMSQVCCSRTQRIFNYRSKVLPRPTRKNCGLAPISDGCLSLPLHSDLGCRNLWIQFVCPRMGSLPLSKVTISLPQVGVRRDEIARAQDPMSLNCSAHTFTKHSFLGLSKHRLPVYFWVWFVLTNIYC